MYEAAPGSTSQSYQIFLRNSLNNQPKVGLTALSAGAKAGYVRQGGTGVAFSLITLASPAAAWDSGGFVEIDGVALPGMYRVDVPDAAHNAGAGHFSFTLNFDGAFGEGVLVLLRAPGSVAGAGASSYVVQVLDQSSVPIAGAGVWVSTDAAGTNVVAGALTTSALGAVTFLVDDGDYFVWINAQGYSPTNPYTIHVAGPGGQGFTLAAASAPGTLTASSEHTARVTVHDLYARVMDFGGADVDTRNVRAVRMAVLDGVGEYPTLHTWTYLKTFGRLILCGAYTTGTVAFDLTGGSFERQLTLTGGTWPAWAAAGYVRTSGVIAKVDARISDSVLTLKDPCFIADVAAGSGYTLYRDSYTLPEDFVASDNALAETCWGRLSYIRHSEWVQLARYQESVGRPAWWTLAGDPDRPGRLAMRLYPAPDSDGTLDYCYQRKPRKVTVFDVSSGRASASLADPTLITLSEPLVKAGMVGGVIRLAAQAGDAPDGLAGVNPYEFEGNIVATLSTTQLRVEAAVTQNFPDVAYRISDPVDAEDLHQLMIGRGCEKAFALSRIMKTRQDVHRAWVDAMMLAKEGDAKVLARQSSGDGVGSYGLRLKDRGPIDFSG